MRHSVKFSGLLAAWVCSFFSMSALASNAGNSSSVELTAAPTFQEVESIFLDNCQFCHTGGSDALGGVSMDSEAEIVANAKRIFTAVSSGLMPYGDSEWRNTPDGLKLLEYVKSLVPAETPSAQ